jgi:hypothetical protein
MVLERHIVWYSEYNKFFCPHNFSIFLYVVYILQHVSAVRGYHQVIYIHSFHISSRDSVVGIATSYGLNDRGVGV